MHRDLNVAVRHGREDLRPEYERLRLFFSDDSNSFVSLVGLALRSIIDESDRVGKSETFDELLDKYIRQLRNLHVKRLAASVTVTEGRKED